MKWAICGIRLKDEGLQSTAQLAAAAVAAVVRVHWQARSCDATAHSTQFSPSEPWACRRGGHPRQCGGVCRVFAKRRARELVGCLQGLPQVR